MIKLIFLKRYHGFESIYDLERDIHEAIQDSDLPGEFQGTLKVKITYREEEPDDGEESEDW